MAGARKRPGAQTNAGLEDFDDVRLEQMKRATVASPGPSSLFDRQGRCLAASAAWVDALAWGARPYLGMPIRELVPDLSPRVLEMHRRVLEGAAMINEEDEAYLDQSGRQRWLQCEYRPFRTLNGTVLGYVVHGRDITALATARKQAHDSAERLRMALQAAHAGVFEIDSDAKVFWCSAEFEALVGRSMTFEEASSLTWPMTHPDDVEKVSERVAAHTAGGDSSDALEVRIVLPEGETRWIQTQVNISRAPDGRVVKISGLVMDIDARKRQELALSWMRREAQESAERLSLALEAARAGVFETDFKNKTFWCSPEFSDVMGRPLTWSEASQTCWPVIHPEDREGVVETVMASMNSLKVEPHEVRIELPDGGSRWVDIRAVVHKDPEGQLVKVVGVVLDIDARKRQELALVEARLDAQKNADRLKVALNAGQAGVFETDFKNRAFWCSEEFRQIVERDLTFEEAAGVWPVMHPDDVPQVQAAIDASKDHSEEARAEWRIRLPSGEHRWIEARAQPRRDENGRLQKLVGVIFDIDARKRQELALAEAREQLRANAERLELALQASGSGVFETDFRGRSFWCSPEFEQLVGRPMDFDDVAKPGWDNIHPDDRGAMAAWCGAAIQAGSFEPREFRMLLPSGATRWVEAYGKVHVGPTGEVARVVGLFRDVDARKRQELAVLEARHEAQQTSDRLRVALDAGQAGVFETDFKKRSFWCSPRFAEIVGRELTFEEASGDSWPMTHPDDVAELLRTVELSLAQGPGPPSARNIGSAQSRVVLPSGEVRWVDTSAEIHWAEDGSLERVVGLVLNIDERKRQELALVEAQRAAEAATEAKSQFLANMSHEIRTPMNGVLGVLHLLDREPLSPEARELLEEARGCGQMLAQLLNDVIDFSKIEAGRLELTPEPMDVVDTLQSVAGMLRPQAAAKGLELRVAVEGDGGWILADPVRLRQALFNLIGNAVKFTSAGHVQVRLQVGAEAGNGRRIRFEIEDTGVGIPEEARAWLFQRFHQADGSTARRFGGSGLGLAITRSLAEMMGGEVGFVSEEGVGSTFWFDVRAEAASPVKDRGRGAGEPQAILPLGGMSILVVEDNPTNRLVATKILEGLGASVATAADGALGVEAVQANSYDLILMDVQMPRMDGVEATRMIRGLEGAASRAPIIGLTANALAHQRTSYLAAGMNGVASKPISPTALLGEIARVLEDADAAMSPAA